MAAKYWIKLYHEILQDPKMGRLPDNLWRRAIELFLMAGEVDDQGKLPSVGDMAWQLRLTEETLEDDLTRLESVGILTKSPDGWVVTNFAKRQAPTETIDRVRQFRERQKKQASTKKDNKEVTPIDNDGYANVTKSYIDTDIKSDKESSSNEEGANAPAAVDDKPKRQKRDKEPADIPASIKVYQTIARRLPDKVLWPEIETMVGAQPECLERWGKVITAYIGCGWNKLNLTGMLRFYEENRIPTTEPVRNGAYSNGHHQRNQRDPSHNQSDQTDGTTEVSRGLAAALKAAARTGGGPSG